ncbi:MAG: acetoacetate--CoA ligase [Gammaproteobacteria bacterium]|nr:acetoacetate--CoA ligase [Gammaproteobacteria bacterium]
MSDLPLWQPTPEQVAATAVSGFMTAAARHSGRQFGGYQDLWEWSIDDLPGFWSLAWDYCGMIGDRGDEIVVHPERMPGARWFPKGRLNYAENLLRNRDESDAILFWGEDRIERCVSHAELYRMVSRCRQALIHAGVVKGDRVAGYLPNVPETVIAMLAASSLGAVWSSASPDFGIEGVLDRFGQIQPKILFCTDGYYYNGKSLDCMDKNRELAARLADLSQVVVVPYLDSVAENHLSIPGVSWQDFLAPFEPQEIEFERFPFDHPLFIMFSSGTTGVPKCIVHSAGGTLLQHLKEHQLHADVRPGDRLFYFTTCGWMMWNWLVSGLASGATLLLYDGSPFAGRQRILFDFADSAGMTHFGTSAKFIEACGKFALDPATSHRLDRLRVILSTGSPLAPEGFRYVYEHVKKEVLLASISGGTDIISCFALGSPILPVWSGEIQCRGLGMAVDVFDDDANPIRGDKGELVCTRPFPSMPLGFWNDPDESRYRKAYFERFPRVWCHGDFVELTAHDGMIIYGRSDATLNPGGVRIGTAEIYRQVEKVDEVLESVVIGQQWQNDVRLVLFVKLREGLTLDRPLVDRIKQRIRSHATPRHVPARILQVADIPRTKSGKIVELAVRDLVHGRKIRNLESLANPEALALFRDRPELLT